MEKKSASDASALAGMPGPITPLAPPQTPCEALGPRGEHAPAPGFPILGVGTTAGGLEAPERFFRNLPRDGGLACVVVRHVAPRRKGLVPEPLQAATSLPARRVKGRGLVLPYHVCVIPPDRFYVHFDPLPEFPVPQPDKAVETAHE